MDAHCAADFRCVARTCEPLQATCSADRTESIAKDKTTRKCSPFLCGPSGECLTKCASDSDCVTGLLCNSAGTCESPPPVVADSGGCGVTQRRTAPSGVLALLMLGLAARRRR